MKTLKVFKLIALVSYLFIILAGDMIGVPLFFWLAISVMAGNLQERLMAGFAIIAVLVSFITITMQRNTKIFLLDVGCFLLMATPLLARFIAVPLQLFYYWCFVLPFSIFVLSSIVAMYLSLKVMLNSRKNIIV